MIELRTGQRFDDTVVQALTRVATAVGNARSDGSSPAAGLVKWVTDSEWTLRPVLPRVEIERLLHTTRYWHVASSPYTTEIHKLASDELDDAKARWDFELAELDASRKRWAEGHAIVVADTNIFLHQANTFDETNWHKTANLDHFQIAVRFVIPIIVIDEIDRQKDVGNRPETKTRARTTLKTLVTIFGDNRPDKRRTLASPDGGVGCAIEILADPAGPYIRRRRPDDEIIRRIEDIRLFTTIPITLVTSDTGMRVRALQAGIRTIHLDRPPDPPKPDKR